MELFLISYEIMNVKTFIAVNNRENEFIIVMVNSHAFVRYILWIFDEEQEGWNFYLELVHVRSLQPLTITSSVMRSE